MGTMGLAILLMVSTDKTQTQLFPIFAISSIIIVGIYLWFIIISCLTFVLIRDKSRLTEYVQKQNLVNYDFQVSDGHLPK